MCYFRHPQGQGRRRHSQRQHNSSWPRPAPALRFHRRLFAYLWEFPLLECLCDVLRLVFVAPHGFVSGCCVFVTSVLYQRVCPHNVYTSSRVTPAELAFVGSNPPGKWAPAVKKGQKSMKAMWAYVVVSLTPVSSQWILYICVWMLSVLWLS